jgi:hypothetical protein
MIRKLKNWFARRKHVTKPTDLLTRAQAERIAQEYGVIRYNDGKRDGLAIAREQAQNSLKEILWQQNQQK